jgi:hypothetical protein
LPDAGPNHASQTNKKPRITGAFVKRLKGLEPSTFCMASGVTDQIAAASYLEIASIFGI